MTIFDQMNLNISEFDRACNEFIESSKKTICTMQDCRQAIRDNHMVNLPLLTPDVYNEFETTIDKTLYLVNYRGEVTDPTFEDEKYDIEILSICQCPVADINGDYVPLEKIEKEIYDTLLQQADDHYFNNYLHDDCLFFDNSSCAYDQSLF